MKNIFRVLALISAFIALSYSAFAVGEGNPREACREDARSFCSDVQPGGGRIIHCLQDHYKELSDDCYMALQNLHARGAGNRDNNAQPPQNDNGGPPPHNEEGNYPPPPPPRDGNNEGPPPDSIPGN